MTHPHASSQRPRLAVFISGGGRTLLNLHDRILDGSLIAEIPLVVASKPCTGVDRALACGLHTIIMLGDIAARDLAALLAEFRIDLVVLAGYLKLLPISKELEGGVINIHPALLPKYGGPGMYGHRVHEAVLAAGDTESGCTVHLCDNIYDRGEILLQRRCPVLADDTPHSLAARVFEQELLAYPTAIKELLKRVIGLPRDGRPASSQAS